MPLVKLLEDGMRALPEMSGDVLREGSPTRSPEAYRSLRPAVREEAAQALWNLAQVRAPRNFAQPAPFPLLHFRGMALAKKQQRTTWRINWESCALQPYTSMVAP